MTSHPLRGIVHPVIITRDLDRALAYYRDLLGFVPRPVTTHDPKLIARLGGPANVAARAVILHAPDGSELEIAEFTAPGGEAVTRASWADAGIRSITFRVTDIAAMIARLAAAGYPLANEIVEFFVDGTPVLVAYVAAPDGVTMTLLQDGKL
jgi:catechol 2,3-dioxygenase-like lactoylglutathione lyase family enzyme